jgi:Aspartate racemase
MKQEGIYKLKTIGLLGGMNWESTVTYYQILNEAIKCELGGLHSAKVLLYSVDFSEIEMELRFLSRIYRKLRL